MLAMLQFYLATICQEVSGLMESVSRRELAALARDGATASDGDPMPEASGLPTAVDDELPAEDGESEQAVDDPTTAVDEAAEEEEDDNFISMQLSSTMDSQAITGMPLTPTLTFAMTLEALSSATLEVPAHTRPSLSAWLLQRALRQCGHARGMHMVMLSAALGCETDSEGSIDPAAIAAWHMWLQRWWEIMSRHLPHEVELPAPTCPTLPAAVPSSPPRAERTNNLALVMYDDDSDGAGTEVDDTLTPAAPSSSNGTLDMLVTVASSVDQTSSRLQPVRVPTGECVAITLVASVRRDAGANASLESCEVDTATRWPSAPVLARQRAAPTFRTDDWTSSPA